MTDDHGRALAAEFLGTALLVSAVVGSGIVLDRGGADGASVLFQHAVVVGAALVALILVFGPVSGAHLNPAVTAVDWWFAGVDGRRALGYVTAQVSGALVGAMATNAMFGESVATWASTVRAGVGVAAGEGVATAGLVLVIFALVHTGRTSAIPGAVGAWVGAAIVFTSSASFANPAVTLARAITDTWTGIAPSSVPGYLAGQAIGTVVATGLVAWFFRPTPDEAADVVQPHGEGVTDQRAPTGSRP